MPDREIIVGLVIICITWLVIYLVYQTLIKTAEWTLAARDALRDRYGNSRWKPHAIDLAGVPAWLAIEVFCLVAGLVIGLLLLWMVVDTATKFRDWWHEGDHRN